jgi:anti-sigma regulatory factor (Ser/Thr protein kinase)
MNSEPLASRLELAAQLDASPWARRHTRSVLGAWGLTAERIDTVELCVSELVSNAVRISDETPGAPVTRIVLTLRHLPGELIVEVADGFRRPPVRSTNIRPEAEGGRGLFIVEALSKEWGYFQPPTGGKVVWSAIALV